MCLRLLSTGAWQTLYEWLSEFKDLDDTPMLVLLLQMFLKLPVTMEMLKSTKSAKLIKSLVKHEHKGYTPLTAILQFTVLSYTKYSHCVAASSYISSSFVTYHGTYREGAVVLCTSSIEGVHKLAYYLNNKKNMSTTMEPS